MSPERDDTVAADDLEVGQNPGSKKAAAIIGGALLVGLLALCVLIPNPSDSQCAIIRFIMAVVAGLMSIFFLGGVTIQGTLWKYAVKAGGGFALFVLIQFVVDPFQLQTAVADAAPNLIPASEDVREAQEELQAQGAYRGPINGRLTSKTRDAIRVVQIRNNLEVDGRLDEQTKQLIVDN